MMSTIARSVGEEQWVQIPATWATYLGLLHDKGEKSAPKYIYHNGRLTIVSPGRAHEVGKLRISWFIETILTLLEMPFLASGSVTLKQGIPKKRGVEGDTSYYLTNLERIRGKGTITMGIDPPPDLEVEVVVSHPVEDALAVHASFGVREVWVCEGSELTFLALNSEGRYEPTPVSRVLSFLSSEEFAPWVFREEDDEGALRREFMAWVTMTLAPRLR